VPHKSQLGALIIDGDYDDLDAAAAFWAAALGLAERRDPDSPNYVFLEGEGSGLEVAVQRIAHEPRVHLDIETDDIEAEVARLEKAGAVRVRDGLRWVVMRAPTGHHFCVVGPGRPGFATDATEWP